MTAPRVFFYVQHLLGIGHLARASHVAGALVADGFDVTMVTGGAPVAGFPAPGIATVALPPVRAGDAGFSDLADLDGNPVDADFKARRIELLLEAFRACAPDIVVIEAYPFGRRQMRFELLPLLDAVAAANPRPRRVVSLRDILQERAKPGRAEETVNIVNRHFDCVMVHGDPAFATLEETFPLAPALTARIAYTGLVAALAPVPSPVPSTERYEIVVSAGGGAAGRGLVAATVAAAWQDGSRWCLITGPNLPDDAFAAAIAAAPPKLSVFRFRPDFAALLGAADLSVSQAGYNTVCDVLRARCRALFVPFTAGGETEQAVRASRLRALGLASVLPEQALSGATLADAIGAALAGPRPPPHTLDLDGARRSAAILRGLL